MDLSQELPTRIHPYLVTVVNVVNVVKVTVVKVTVVTVKKVWLKIKGVTLQTKASPGSLSAEL